MGAGLLFLSQRCRLSGESRNPRNLNPEEHQVDSSPRATLGIADAFDGNQLNISGCTVCLYDNLRAYRHLGLRGFRLSPERLGGMPSSRPVGMTLPASRIAGQLVFFVHHPCKKLRDDSCFPSNQTHPAGDSLPLMPGISFSVSIHRLQAYDVPGDSLFSDKTHTSLKLDPGIIGVGEQGQGGEPLKP